MPSVSGLVSVESKVSCKILELYELRKPVRLFHQKGCHLFKKSPLQFEFTASFLCLLR